MCDGRLVGRLPRDYMSLQARVQFIEFAGFGVQSVREGIVHFGVSGWRRLRDCHFAFLAPAKWHMGECVCFSDASPQK